MPDAGFSHRTSRDVHCASRIAFLLLALLSLSLAARGDWRSELTPLRPGKLPPPRAQTARYTFGWSAFTAAEAQIDFTRVSGGRLELAVKTKTTGVVRGLWQMDGTHRAVARAATLRPVSVVQSEIYEDESEKVTLAFDSTGVSRKRESKPAPPGDGKVKRFKYPDTLDLHCALLFIRSQRLAPGDKCRLCVYPTTAPYFAEVSVAKRETMKVAGKKYPALKLDLKLQKIGKDLALAPHTKLKRCAIWVSDDADRLLLKIEADVAVGHVWMELEKVEFR